MEVQQHSPSSRTLTLAITALGFVIVTLDVTIVNVALPALSSALRATVDDLQWIVDAYTLAFAGLLLTAGVLGDRFGSRRAFCVGLLVFATASVICGASPNTVIMIAARALQGIGGALLVPSSLALLAAAYSADEQARIRAVAQWSAAGGLAVAAGPVIGGFLVATFGWRSIFLVNAPICALGLWLTLRYIARDAATQTTAGRFDWNGLIAGLIALVALTATVIEAGAVSGIDRTVAIGLVTSVVAGALFVWFERRSAAPVLSSALFSRRGFSAATALGGVVNFTFYGLIFVLSLYFQQSRGYSAALTGLAFLPLTALIMPANILGGWAGGRWGLRYPIALGHLLAALGYGSLWLIDAQTSFGRIAFGLVLIALSAISVPLLTTEVLASAAGGPAGTASAVFNTARQVGGAMGVAAFGALARGTPQAIASGVAITGRICAVIMTCAAIIALVALRTPDSDAM
jgi:MFS transporter, DHA2 family, methylenomycin A resistance protein